MKISLKWLQQYLPISLSAKELENILPTIGHEVDAVHTFGLPPLPHVVVGQILESNPHPDAERLSVCKVKVHPTEAPLQIVCGAKNYTVGDYVPVALEGACLPGDFKIKRSKLRGVESFGMMCSPRELGLGNDQGGLLILQSPPPVGTPINQAFPESDTILDIALTANRGDCMSHIGIARELAAYYDTKVLYPKIENPVPFESYLQKNSLLKHLYPLDAQQSKNSARRPSGEAEEPIVIGDEDRIPKGNNAETWNAMRITVESPNCPYFTASFIEGIKIAPSPDWLQKALQSIGMRSINNIVDITNWVMYETGQPLHAFDLAKIKGHHLVVRQAHPDEIITTLDNKKRTLQPSMTVIADSERPLVVAGIMGSIDAEVDNSTTDIVLESAYFKPSAIRHTARALGLNTDSAQRFMRDADPQAVTYAANRAIQFILQIAGGKVISPSVAIGTPPREPHTVTLDPHSVEKVCGFPIPQTSIENIFRRLGFTVQKNHTEWLVTLPTYRAEVYRHVDLVEEFLRIYGTDKIPNSPVTLKGLHRNDHPIAVFNQAATNYLVSQHFNECYHYSLRSQNELKSLFDDSTLGACALANPLTSDYSHLRPSLLPGLFDAFRLNQNNGNAPARLFEVGRVFRNLNNETCELLSVAFILAKEPTQRHWLKSPTPDFFQIKNILIQIAQFAGISPDNLHFALINNSHIFQNNHAASAGDLLKDNFQLNCGLANLRLTKDWGITPPLLCGEIFLLSKLLPPSPPLPRFQPFSNFPTSSKDIALIVDESLPADSIRQTLLKLAHQAVENTFDVENISLFDVYQGPELHSDIYAQQSMISSRRPSGEAEEPIIIGDEGRIPKGNNEETWNAKRIKKSLAFSITFQAPDRTLTDEEVLNAFNKLQSLIKETTNFEIRTT